MMKTILKVGGVILLLLVAALLVISVSLNSIIKTGVETLGPTITGTNVTLEDVDFSLFSGQGRLEKMVIYNPPGFNSAYAFSLGMIHVKADLTSALSDTIIIEEIFIDSPEISFEGTLSGSNIGRIHENIDAFAGSAGGKAAEGGSSGGSTSSEKKIQIDQFILKDAKIILNTPILKGQQVTLLLQLVQIRDIGKGPGGITLRGISSLVFSRIQEAIEQEISKSGMPVGPDLKKMEKELEGIVKEASKVLKGILGK